MLTQSNHIGTLLSFLDWITFTAVILLTVGAVFWGHHRQKQRHPTATTTSKTLEYLLMGRQLTLPLFIGTLVSTWYGGILGVTQISYEHGLYNFMTQGIFWYVSYAVFALFFAKKIHRSQAVTLPDLIQKMFGNQSAKFAAAFIFFKAIPITYAISIGVFLDVLWGIGLNTGIFIGVGFVVGYSIFGGFRAVVYSDAVQFSIMYVGVLSVLICAVWQFGGLSFLQENLPETHFTLCSTYSVSATLVWLFMACATTFINPVFYQRCLAAKSETVATKGILISIGIWFIFDVCTTLGGMYARAVLPDAGATHGYLLFSLHILPDGLKGLLLASIVATILSTLDSFLFVASAIFSHDLKLFGPRFNLMKHKITLALVGLFTGLLSLSFEGHIQDVWRIFKGYFSSCLLFPILWGYLFPNTLTDRAFVRTCLIGLGSVALYHLSGCYATFGIDLFYIGTASTLMALLVPMGTRFSKHHLVPNNARK